MLSAEFDSQIDGTDDDSIHHNPSLIILSFLIRTASCLEFVLSIMDQACLTWILNAKSGQI